MFQQLFFLLIALLTLESSFSLPIISVKAPIAEWSLVGLTYFGVLLLFLFQRKLFYKRKQSRKQPARLLIVGMVELIIWLFIAVNGFNLQLAALEWKSFFIKAVFLFLYLLAACFLQLTTTPTFSLKKYIHSLKGYSFLFFVPFASTYLFFQIFNILIAPFSEPNQSDLAGLLNILLTLAFALIILSIMAPLTIKIWGCKPLKNTALKKRLEERCREAHFHHRGLLVWGVMNQSVTAAIFGFMPRLRYILFTEPLLENFTEDEIESVLLHELGHYHYKHLFLYPLICLGAGIFLSFFYAYSEPFIDQLGEVFGFFLFFLLSIGFIFFYFRLIFGFFSRRFERAADLYPLKKGVDPHHLISALNKISILTHTPLKQPNWHHGSIKNRIDAIERAWLLPSIVKKYEAGTRAWIFFYMIIFLTFATLFFIKLF